MKTILAILAIVMLTACAAPEPTGDLTDTLPLDETPEETPTETPVEEPGEESADPEIVPEDIMPSEPDVTFVVTGENFKFVMDGEDNPTLRVQQGDLVRIEFSSTQGYHDFVIDEFDVFTERVRETDGVTVVEFVADEAGEFDYYCSVGSHRANGMEGTLIVE